MRQFNSNYMLAGALRQMVKDAGIVLPEPTRERDKAHGFMGSRGLITIGDCAIDTYGHYSDEDDDSHYSLKFYKKKDAYWHLGVDDEGIVWFSPSGCFHHAGVEDLNDWVKTPFTIK